MADEVDQDINNYSDPANSDETFQTAVDISVDAGGEPIDAAQVATQRAADIGNSAPADESKDDESKRVDQMNFFDSVADFILQHTGNLRSTIDEHAKNLAEYEVATQAHGIYDECAKFLQSHPSLSDDQLVALGNDVARHTIQQDPFREVRIRALQDELLRRHRAPKQNIELRRNPAAMRQGLVAPNDAPTDSSMTGKMHDFYVQTRRYAHGLAWADLWQRYTSALTAVQPNAARGNIVPMIQYKCYANEVLSRYRHAGKLV